MQGSIGLPPKLLNLKHILVISLVALYASVGKTAPAEAQIYSWRDDNGVLTVSDRPKGAGPRALAVPVGAPLPREANPHLEPVIRQHADQQGIRPDLVRAVIQVESNFNPRAVSPKGAMGLMQLMPATAAEFGVTDPFNPIENIRAGVRYLRQLLDRYDKNEQLALAAYNAGPGAVDKYGSKVPPYKETQNYVQKISDIRGTVRHAPGTQMYRVVEIVDGRRTVKYTNTKPSSGDFEEVLR
jgi:soluble lytic murein transglycosylase-like protein